MIRAPLKSARVIITFQCQRSCRGCCNTYGRIMKQAISISDLATLANFGIICITGGEPLLEPDYTLDIVAKIRRQHPSAALYLYTALYAERMPDIVRATDGIHYTLHEGATDQDIDGLQRFQQVIRNEGNGKSFRLYIDKRVERLVSIQPNLWKRVEVKPWLSEEELLAMQPSGLPPNETLFILHKQN